jgi:integrase/recombinase XerD
VFNQLAGNRLDIMSAAVVAGARGRRVEADRTLIRSGFAAYLRARHAAVFTTRLYCRFLDRVAEAFARRGRSICTLRKAEVSSVLRKCLPGWKAQSCRSRQAALHAWLRFRGCFAQTPRPSPRQRLLDAYGQFLQVHRGLAPCTRSRYLQVAGDYLRWQLRRTAARWSEVRPEHIWRFAERRACAHAPKTLVDECSALRQFLRFLHVRGVITLGLSQAVPRAANSGQAARKEVLTDEQRRRFLAGFDQSSPEGRRDYTMALCMLDLGLRAIEIRQLRLADIDWSRQRMRVPPAKAGLGRELPIPAHVLEALRRYAQARPASCHAELFVGHKRLVGRPLSSCAIGSAMSRAYRRCGFPARWHGSHRLRHTFATRLCAHGASLKQIADLLGHRAAVTANRYAHVDPQGLRALSQPWPR